jgi:hypothetical protein
MLATTRKEKSQRKRVLLMKTDYNKLTADVMGRFGATTSSRGAPLARRRSLLWNKLLVQDPSNIKASSPTAASVSLMLAAFDLWVAFFDRVLSFAKQRPVPAAATTASIRS